MLALQDNQISLSQIVKYKKQLDSCKKELEEEKRRGQRLKAEVHVHVLGYLVHQASHSMIHTQRTNILYKSLETVTLNELAHLQLHGDLELKLPDEIDVGVQLVI